MLLLIQDYTTILFVLLALIAGFFISQYLNRQDGLTKSAMFWANYQEPLIYRQQDLNTRDQTVSAYDNAISKLTMHGNQHLNPQKDVYLWLYGAEEEKMNIDFAEWSFQAISLEKKIREDFRIQKLQQAAAAGNVVMGAKYFTGQTEDFNDIPKSNN